MPIPLLAAAATTEPPASSGTSTPLLIAAVLAGGYLLSLHPHPHTHCRSCQGNSRSYGTIYTHAFRLCGACGGRGRQRRLGARLLGARLLGIGSD